MKWIQGYEGLYSITKEGEIWSHITHKHLKTSLSGKGYKATKLSFEGKSITVRIHRLVAQTYIPNPENKPQVNHIDGNKLNNHVSNLEWVTGYENMYHAKNTGLLATKANGKRTNRYTQKPKLSAEDIQYIIDTYVKRHKKFGCVALAKQFGVNRSTISKILNKNIA